MSTLQASISSRVAAHMLYSQAQNGADFKALCLGDLFFLLVHGMRRKDLNNDWCFARCREVQMYPDGYLDLWAREHYKSRPLVKVGFPQAQPTNC